MTSPKRFTLALVAGLLAVAVLGGAAWWGYRTFFIVQVERPPAAAPPAQQLSRPQPRPEDYVGSAACTTCHAKIAAAYSSHPMAQSMHNVAQRDDREDYEQGLTFSPLPTRRYEVEVTPTMVRHHEFGLGANGETLYDHAAAVRYAVGSGRRGRSYLFDREGQLFMSPISWYAADRKWDLSPEYRAEGSPRFEHPAAERCLVCHAGRQAYAGAKTTETALVYQDPPFTELSIGCERCHGPGGEHVRLHKAGPLASAADPIVNPARLDPPRREAVCNQCHLQGEVQILRYGRRHDDFRPGDHLGDVWSVFVSGTGVAGDGATTAVSHVEQMTSSRCYRSSRGRLGCISCHDPHSFPQESERLEFYKSRCQKCHSEHGCSAPAAEQAAPPASGSCIACHMPRLTARDVPHTTQTDHRVVRKPLPKRENPTVSSEPDKSEALSLFDEPFCPLSPLELARAHGLAVAGKAEAQSHPGYARQAEALLASVRAAAPDDVDVLDSLAVACALQGKMGVAVQLWEEALSVAPQRQDVLYALAVHYHRSGNLVRAGDYLDRLVEVNPWRAEYHFRRADTFAKLGQFERGIAAAKRAVELDPSVAQAHGLLGELLGKAGKEEESQRELQMAAKLASRRTSEPPKPAE